MSADTASPVTFSGLEPFPRWDLANVVRGRANGIVSAYAWCRLGDITTEQFRGLAQIQRDFDTDIRITNRQNFALRDLDEGQLLDLWKRLAELDMAETGAELARDVVSCPGADTCNLAVTQSRGLAADIGTALEPAGLAEVGGIKINISGCTNSCGQHHIADIGFLGLERRAHGRAAPGYQMLLGGRLGNMEIGFGEKATKLPGQGRVAGGRPGRRPLRRRAQRRRDVLAVARPLRRRRRGGHHAQGPRPLPRPPRRRPTSSSTSTRPGPTWPRSARASARHDRHPGPRSDVGVPDLAELAEVSRRLETAPASAAVRWAHERFGSGIVLAASFQDCVLIDLAVNEVPDIEVAFLDTQYHFAETLWYVEQVRSRYDLNLNVVKPEDRARRHVAQRPRRLLRDPQGRAARTGRSRARPRG